MDEEKIKYRDICAKSADLISELLGFSAECDDILEDSETEMLLALQKKCTCLYNRLCGDEFRIAVVGSGKSGKSTLANALMGCGILPSSAERCTYVPTFARHGGDLAEIEFFAQSEHPEISDEIRQFIGQPPTIYEYNDDYGNDVRAFISDPTISAAVKRVRIESSKLSESKNFAVCDLPDLDFSSGMHIEQMIKDCIDEADAIVFAVSLQNPCFTESALKMLVENADEYSIPPKNKMFIFGNRADCTEKIEKNIRTLKSQAVKSKLLDKNSGDERFSAGSAKGFMQNLDISDGNYIAAIVRSETYLNAWAHGDGIEHICEKLMNYRQNECFELIKNAAEKNYSALKKIFRALKKKYCGNEEFSEFLKELLSDMKT